MGSKANPGPAVFEITPDKKVVWTCPEDLNKRVTTVMGLDEEVIEKGALRWI